MEFHHEMSVLVLKSNRRVVGFTPNAGFVAPAQITIVDAAGIHRFSPGDWVQTAWKGHAPKGFTAQTCYLFELTEAGELRELGQSTQLEQVVL